MNLSKTIVSKKVLFIKRKLEMRKAMTIITQVLIFTVAWFILTPDTLEDNTYVFGLIGNVEVIKGNADWVLLGAAILSALNIYFWWPKGVDTPSEKPVSAEGTKSAKVEEKDPVVPKMD